MITIKLCKKKEHWYLILIDALPVIDCGPKAHLRWRRCYREIFCTHTAPSWDAGVWGGLESIEKEVRCSFCNPTVCLWTHWGPCGGAHHCPLPTAHMCSRRGLPREPRRVLLSLTPGKRASLETDGRFVSQLPGPRWRWPWSREWRSDIMLSGNFLILVELTLWVQVERWAKSIPQPICFRPSRISHHAFHGRLIGR